MQGTEMCSVESTAATEQPPPLTCPISLFAPRPTRRPLRPPERSLFSPVFLPWGGKCLQSCLLPSGETLGYCNYGGCPGAVAPNHQE